MNGTVKQFEKEYGLFVLQKLRKLNEHARAEIIGGAVEFYCDDLMPGENIDFS